MKEPGFISWREIEIIHAASIERFGGTHGIRDEHLIHSALGAAMNDFRYAAADLAGIAAAYAFHIAQAQAFLDGNKRTAIGAALVFLERSGVETKTQWDDALYAAMHAVAEKRMDKASLAELFRSLLVL
ncbi:type II toxin-antitoxin system death-on-curing family toxin [Prosthecobacter sp.]|uniref:type II toxin-antitoxin system death-on-curing family toxin n=1 Tax=Prosthecobacter sp. TaxID=1965333 RepID=UPI002AB8F0B5|nr:type II toxin-antitoxin system death-on-curing family toxin [Prosthecobacter sp.]MDZ4402360.1 type II toxin-antitoxin system death-on-curing family toxin [Prosthecobacter sp.]